MSSWGHAENAASVAEALAPKTLTSPYSSDDLEAVRTILPWLKAAAESGLPHAQKELGTLYFEGVGVPVSYDEALKWFNRAAEQGNAAAMHNLATMHFHGVGVPASREEALTWWHKSAEKGFPVAYYNLASVYGGVALFGGNADLALCMEWALKAHAAGLRPQLWNPARMFVFAYESSEPRPDVVRILLDLQKKGLQKEVAALLNALLDKDVHDLAFRPDLLKAACACAECGGDESIDVLGNLLIFGKAKDDEVGIVCDMLKKLAAQDKGKACEQMGTYYADCEDAPQSFAEAMKWYEKGAALGDGLCMYHLAQCYANGQGVYVDMNEAFRWYSRSVAAGCTRGYYGLAMCYLNGDGVEKNTESAHECLMQAVDAQVSPALYLWGTTMMRNGRYAAALELLVAAELKGDERALQLIDEMLRKEQISTDDLPYAVARHYYANKLYNSAMTEFERGASMGDPDCMLMAGIIYLRGESKTLSLAKAVKWLTRASEKKQAMAMCELAHLWADGVVTGKTRSDAAQLYKESAELGWGESCFQYGLMLMRGDGVACSKSDGAAWIQKVADKGHAYACYTMAVLYSRGEGVQQDNAKASHYLHMAAEAGHPDARRLLEKAR